jgi:hypothetical protein
MFCIHDCRWIFEMNFGNLQLIGLDEEARGEVQIAVFITLAALMEITHTKVMPLIIFMFPWLMHGKIGQDGAI